MGNTDSRLKKALQELEAEETRKRKKFIEENKNWKQRNSNEQTIEDIAPYVEDAGWINRSAKGTTGEKVLGTAGDVAENLVTGIAAIPELLVDAFAAASPYIAQSQQDPTMLMLDEMLNPSNAKLRKEAEEQGKQEIAKFVAQDLYNEQELIKNTSKAILGVDVDEYSVLGQKADALVQSGGQLLGQTAVNAALPGSGMALMAATAFGGEAENALNNGATLDQAVLSAAASAGAEVLTEKLGGISFGGKTLTDAAFGKLSKNMTSKLARLLITTGKIGVDALSEGGEEILSGYLSAAAQKLTYMSDKEISEIFTKEDALDAFLGGFLLGDIFETASTVTNVAKGVDPISGLTKNEKTVVDNVYNETVKERESNGKKLSNSEKNKLYESTISDMEKGRISVDKIVDIFGDKSTYDSLSKESDEFKTLYETEGSKLSEKQKDRLAELKEKNSKKSYEDALNEAKQANTDKVYELVKGDRLSESFNEKARRSQKFEADLSQYDEKQRKIVQKAIDSEFLNNTNRTHELVDLIANIASQKDLDFDFTNNEKLKASGFALEGKTVNGFITENGVTLNINSAKVLNSVVGHEVTHVLEGTDLYNALSDAVMKYATSKEGVDGFNKRLADLESLYKGDKNTTPEKELVADLVGDYLFTDSEFVNRLSTENRNVFEKIYDEIKYLCRVATAGSKEARELEKVKKMFEDAYRAGGKSNASTIDTVLGNAGSDKVEVVDDIAVASNTAEVMKSPEYSKPKDYMARYSVSTTDAWAENYLETNKTEDAENVVKAVKNFTEKMVQDDAVRGYVPMGEYKATKMGPLRTNQEYIWTFDMDTSCPRTFQFLNFRDAIQRKAGRYLTYNESINLLELMRAYGQQIPCCYCYVENKRVLLSASYNNFFGFRDAVMKAATDEDAAKVMYGYSEKKGLPDASKKALARWRSDPSYNPSLTEVWTATNTARNSVLNFLDGLKESGSINAKTAESKLNRLVLDHFGIEDKGAVVEIESFVKDWAYDTLANIPHIYNTDNNTDVSVVDERALALNHEALAYSKSASSAKSVENYIPYTDQLKNVSEEDREYIMGMGGIRKHSSNDFRMDYVQDYFLFYADLAAGKWTGHTYTKSADFAKIFACTNDRINMSVAFYEDADGTLRPNTDEGAAWQDVKELRNAYKNVGAMAMVTSDNQLSYALNSDWIDMIIPFHASGLDKSVWYNLRMWNDYTSKQGERFFNADTMKQKLKSAGVEIPKGANASTVKALYEDTFQVKHIYGKNGEVLKPHFFPGDTYVNGQLIPGHGNDVETYFKLCEEYGVHPRFYGIKVTDTNGNQIDVTEHPSYLKLIKETSRTDSAQEAIQFNFGNYDDHLKMTPFEYAMQRLQEEAKNGGFENTKADPYGVVKEFTEEYLNKDRPLGYLTERATETRDMLLEMSRESAKKQTDILAEAQKSLSKADETPKQYGNWNIRGEDVALREIAPTKQSSSEIIAPYEDNWRDSFDSLTDADAPPDRSKPTAGNKVENVSTESQAADKFTRKQLHQNIVANVKDRFKAKGFDFDKVLKNAKNLSTFATVDNTPQRVMEKALGYKEGQVLSDLTVNQVAQNETDGIRWLNSFTDRKNGLLANISKQYQIKPGSKQSAAAQMYAEGFYVDKNNNIIQYGDKELAADFPDAQVQKNIKGLARDPRIRKIYDQTLEAINESRRRNAYPEIPRLDNYFLHFRAMEDTFSRLGLPFNPNDIKAKDLPTDLNGVTADLKPGQPYFASAMHRTGKRTSFDLLGGLERYLTSAKNQIYHIDDIQNLRALRNYIADTYGQANGLEGLDELSEEEAQERIEKVYGSHLSTFAKFLNEEANILAGKTSLIDRGLEGVFGRRGITFLDSVNKQVGSNMVGFNISSSLTNFLPVAQTFAKTNKYDFVKAFAQTVGNKVGSTFGRTDSFAENSPVIIRRKGADRFYRTPWQKMADPGYALMGIVDDISTELIARTKYNEFTRKGMDSQTAHIETDKWVSRLMGDRSLGQQPQLYNSKMLGLLTKFQLEVRNQLDSQFYDTIKEAEVSNEHIQSNLLRNAKTAAKVATTFAELAVVQHLFGTAFESVAGYNPAFDIVEVIAKAFGWDDEEEEPVLDNVEEAFFTLLEDLPYTSTFTGGRIPIESALPIEEFVTGTDQYGNEKSRWETLREVAPYYFMPGGYGQLKKTAKGVDMFSDEHPVAGSYTDSGNMRFPVEDTLANRAQAAVFGQYASENARYFFDNEIAPMDEKQIKEYSSLDIPIRDYWNYRDTAKKLDKMAKEENATDDTILKSKYLNSVGDELSDILKEQKEIAEDITLTQTAKTARLSELESRFEELSKEAYSTYEDVTYDSTYKDGDLYASVGDRVYKKNDDGEWKKLTDDQVVKYNITKNADNPYYATDGQLHYRKDDEGDWVKITDKQLERQIEVTNSLGITPAEYWSETSISFIPMSKGEYEYAYDSPENYALAKSVGGYDSYTKYSKALSNIKADKDKEGKSVSGSRQKKVADYINSLNIGYYEKLVLFKSQYPSYDDKNKEIIKYINGRDDLTKEERNLVLTKLGFTVSNGKVTWK